MNYIKIKDKINYEYKEKDFNIDKFDDLISIIDKNEKNIVEIKTYLKKCIENLSTLLHYCTKNSIDNDKTKEIKNLENNLKSWEESNFVEIDKTYLETLFKKKYVDEYNEIFNDIMQNLFYNLEEFRSSKKYTIEFEKIYVYKKYTENDDNLFVYKRDIILLKNNLFLFNLHYPFFKIGYKLLYEGENKENNPKTEFTLKVENLFKNTETYYNKNIHSMFYSENTCNDSITIPTSEKYYEFLRKTLGDLLED